MDGGASSPATATPSESDTISCGNRFDWKFERLRPSRAHPEAEGTDSPPHHPFSDSAEILRISGRGICKEAIFSPGGQAPAPKKSAPGATNQNLRFRLVGREATCLPFGQATFPPRRSLASIGSREGSHPLALSRGCSDGDFGFRRSGLFFCGRCFRRHGRGALRSPTPPWGTGARGLRALSRSPRWGTNGDFWMGKGGFVLLLFLLLFWRRILFPTTRGWGVLLPYIPLGDGVREGCAPSRVLRGGGRTEIFWMGKGES